MLHRRIGRALAIAPDDDDILAADAARHADQADDGAICAAASARAARRCRPVARLRRSHRARRARPPSRPPAGRPSASSTELRLIDVLLHPGLRLRDPGDATHRTSPSCPRSPATSGSSTSCPRPPPARPRLSLGLGRHPTGPRAAATRRPLIERERTTESSRCSKAPAASPTSKSTWAAPADLFDELARSTTSPKSVPSNTTGASASCGPGRRRRPAHDAALGHAIQFATPHDDHWTTFECAARLALLEIETGQHRRHRSSASSSHPLAAKLGHGAASGSTRGRSRALAALDPTSRAIPFPCHRPN